MPDQAPDWYDLTAMHGVRGFVTDADGDVLPSPPPRWLPRPAGIVAPGPEQARHWAKNLLVPAPHGGFRHLRGARDLHGGDGDLEEVFFCGVWAREEVELLHEVALRCSMLKVRVTHVNDAWGEPILPRAAWWRWPAESTGKRTSWHLPADWHPSKETLCGLVMPYAWSADGWLAENYLPPMGLPVGQAWAVVRYGPPRGACGICAHEARKLDSGDLRSNNDALRRAAGAVERLPGDTRWTRPGGWQGRPPRIRWQPSLRRAGDLLAECRSVTEKRAGMEAAVNDLIDRASE